MLPMQYHVDRPQSAMIARTGLLLGLLAVGFAVIYPIVIRATLFQVYQGGRFIGLQVSVRTMLVMLSAFCLVAGTSAVLLISFWRGERNWLLQGSIACLVVIATLLFLRR